MQFTWQKVPIPDSTTRILSWLRIWYKKIFSQIHQEQWHNSCMYVCISRFRVKHLARMLISVFLETAVETNRQQKFN